MALLKRKEVKIIDRSQLDTDALRDLLAEMKIIEDRIGSLRPRLGVIYNAPSAPSRKVQFFHREGEVGILVKDLKDFRGALSSLRGRIRPAMRALIGALREIKKE